MTAERLPKSKDVLRLEQYIVVEGVEWQYPEGYSQNLMLITSTHTWPVSMFKGM